MRETGLSTPDISALPRIALLFRCSLDHLFDMDCVYSDTPDTKQFEHIRSLRERKDYASLFSLELRRCESRRSDFSRLAELIRVAVRFSLYDHPELENLLPLVTYAERFCQDQDTLFNIFSAMVTLSARTGNPRFTDKAREYYDKLPHFRYGREIRAVEVLEGDELRQQLILNLQFYADCAECAARKLADFSDEPEDKIFYHQTAAGFMELLFCGHFGHFLDGHYLNNYHKMAWNYMRIGKREEAQRCIDHIFTALRRHMTAEGRHSYSPLFNPSSTPGAPSPHITAMQLLRRMERHPDLAVFREEISAFRKEYESHIEEIREDSGHAK